ncbi:alpha-amylase family glycosyl hydrolase, partial [Balneolaceae bacterium ANBcel3]|nr:alpha-amylase family glycosyl hydrolase [Balneolaceae bacterium ANBcel3]
VILSDPYARSLAGRDEWLAPVDWGKKYPFRSRLVFEDFDWEGDRPLDIPTEELVIYEMHVRGFTRHPSSDVKHKGTFAAMREKIPYLVELGVNCVELMPIWEFDEYEHSKESPETGELLVNYWGYSTLNFFSPKAGYAASGKYGMQVDEFKTLIKELHKNGIEVILDVVFNHTAEGDHRGPTISFKGIDNKTYYMLTPEGYYYNFSGTGNTLNCNHPVVRNMVLDCLRYWASEYHIDGFRFDLAAILGRAQDGSPLSNPPLLESLAYDPVLAKCKLIAEAWDAGGLYQVGSFPSYGRWAEWNGKYRDAIRKFLKGEEGMTGEISQRIQGSPDMYHWRETTAGINFITCHDGFTLYDLFAYNDKHNMANGEDNRDGANDNYSWNCGCEGETGDVHVHHLRRKMMKNAFAILMLSRGVPMLHMGDEVAHTKGGNNNTYCHDNELNWFNWKDVGKNEDILRFVKTMIRFRKQYSVLRDRFHFHHQDIRGTGYPDLSFHGVQAWNADWSPSGRVLAFMLDEGQMNNGKKKNPVIYVAMNMYWEALPFELPELRDGKKWYMSVNTDMPSPEDIYASGKEPKLQHQKEVLAGPRSIVILIGK